MGRIRTRLNALETEPVIGLVLGSSTTATLDMLSQAARGAPGVMLLSLCAEAK